MNTVDGVWGLQSDGTAGASERLVVEAVLSWRDARGGNVLAVKELAAGGTLAVGEGEDLLIPGDVLGFERFELARFDGERAVVVVPPGAKLRVDGWERSERELEIARGHVTEVLVGAFSVRLTLTRAGTRIAAAPLEGLRRGGAGVILASALAHAAAFAIIAYVSPALGATEDDPFDRDRAALLQKYLNASAQRETEPPPVQQDDAVVSEGGNHNPGALAKGPEGAAGKDSPNTDGRWAARGNAKPENATLSREKALTEAANFGIIGMLPGFTNDPNAPTVPWGTTLNGSDDLSKVGHLFGMTIDEASGAGGWGMSGVGEAGGGFSDSIGIGDIGALGIGGTGRCGGGGPCSGIGSSHDRLMGTHVSHFRGPRYGVPQTNGHLPPEVIQRIVRQNDGRYRFCYQQALKTNPSLEGRVTVKFLIGRDGSVAFSADGGSDIPDTGVRQCVVSSFTQLSFPSPDSGVVTVVYPIVFSPQ